MGLHISLSRWTPRGLFARSLLIIVLPVAIMQIAVTYVFFDLYWENVSRRLSEAAAADIAHVADLYVQDPSPAAFARLKSAAQERLRLSVAFQPDTSLPRTERRATIPAFDRTLRRALDGSLDRPFWFDTTRYPDYVDVRVTVPGGILRFLAYRDRVFASTGGLFFVWLIGVTVLLSLVSVAFIRNQVRPMERLADAAERFGRGESVGLKPAGSAEVRRAATAFLHMRNRIQRHLEQRTNLLASVSHDLRTPLTRLKLELAMMPPDVDLTAAKADLAQMERMLDEYLEFARGQWAEEPEEMDLAALARQVIADAQRGGAAVSADGLAAALPFTGRPGALGRCLANLVENAAGFGTEVAVSSTRDSDAVSLHVDDNGPGIAPENHTEAMRPFSRLDASRNQNRKGVGLGLAIARDAARSHGGDLILSRSPMGGLRASVRLPVSATA
jgi:two-component system, OmpR family, osmolarity sensor histidine kinase EnvZ